MRAQAADFPNTTFGALSTRGSSDKPAQSGASGYDFDPAAIDELRLVFSPCDLQALTLRFETMCESRMLLLTQAVHASDWAGVAAEAHPLGGTAGSFGLYGLTILCRALEKAARAPDSRRVACLLGQMRAALAQGLPRVRAVCAAQGPAPDGAPGGNATANAR
jgi:HPt (histidine-containing phosphotransfer) domain-containing protein